MGPKLMNCGKPEQMGTKEYGKMLKRIQTLEDGRIPAKEANNWRIEGQKRRITRKEYQRLVNKFEMEGFMAQQILWNLAKEKTMKERCAFPKEGGNAVRVYEAMHEEHFLSSWLREDGREKEERMAKVSEENDEERCERGTERRRNKRTKREELTEDAKVLFRWRLLKSPVKVETWRVAGA